MAQHFHLLSIFFVRDIRRCTACTCARVYCCIHTVRSIHICWHWTCVSHMLNAFCTPRGWNDYNIMRCEMSAIGWCYLRTAWTGKRLNYTKLCIKNKNKNKNCRMYYGCMLYNTLYKVKVPNYFTSHQFSCFSFLFFSLL